MIAMLCMVLVAMAHPHNRQDQHERRNNHDHDHDHRSDNNPSSGGRGLFIGVARGRRSSANDGYSRLGNFF